MVCAVFLSRTASGLGRVDPRRSVDAETMAEDSAKQAIRVL